MRTKNKKGEKEGKGIERKKRKETKEYECMKKRIKTLIEREAIVK